jgi:hypothetical protein
MQTVAKLTPAGRMTTLWHIHSFNERWTAIAQL